MMITYRLLNTTDAQVFRQLRLDALQTHPEAFASTYDLEVTLPLSVVENRLLTNEHGFTVGAFAQESLIASCSFRRHQSPFGKHKGLLMGMYCSPNYQGSGVAFELMAFLLKHVRSLADIEVVLLGVISTNKPALHFYQKVGFTIYGHEKNALYDGKTYRSEYLMQLFL